MQMVDSGTLQPSSSNSTGVAPKRNGVNGHTVATTSSASQPNISSGSHAYASQSEESESLDKLLHVSVIVLRQAIDLVNESLSEDAQLTQVSKYIPGSTIGKHLRHATDHFSLLLDSLSGVGPAQEDTGPSQRARDLELSYDVRARGTPMESSRTAARAALETCIERLQSAVPGVERDRAVLLTAVTPYEQTFRTSFGRELWFAALHAVHHWSMIRVIAGELGIQLEDSFGVAPSTLVYRGSEGPLGKARI